MTRARNLADLGGDATGLATDAELSAALASKLDTPVGAVMHFAMSTAPSGWLKANGANVSRSTYSALFAAIGTTFGTGDGSTTFTLPDLRGEFVRGWDDSRGTDSGRTFGSSQTDAFKAHNHSVGWWASVVYDGTTAIGAGRANYPNYYTTTGNTGDSETRPRNIAMLACIKY